MNKKITAIICLILLFSTNLAGFAADKTAPVIAGSVEKTIDITLTLVSRRLGQTIFRNSAGQRVIRIQK